MLDLEVSSYTIAGLTIWDIARVKKARYRATERAKLLRRKSRRRKDLQDKDHQTEGGAMYAPGAFDGDQPTNM